MIYRLTRQELRQKGAKEFKHGDVVAVSKYAIYITYKNADKSYDIPALLTRVEDLNTCKFLDCTPGIGWPYYIADFISR